MEGCFSWTKMVKREVVLRLVNEAEAFVHDSRSKMATVDSESAK